MRSDGIKQQRDGVEFFAGGLAARVNRIERRHYRRDGGIELAGFVIVAHLLDERVEIEVGSIYFAACDKILRVPVSCEEAVAAFDAFGRPRSGFLVISDEEYEHSEHVRAVLFHDVVGVYDVAARFAHLFAVRAEDKPLRRTS